MQAPADKKTVKPEATDDGECMVVDPERIRVLVEMMTENQLTEIRLKSGDEEIRITRQPPAAAPQIIQGTPLVANPTITMEAPASAAAVEGPKSPPAGAAAAPAEVDDGLVPIVSPMVGTFYAAPDPQAAPYETVGSKVNKTTVVGVLEAMKVFNELVAGLSGTIVEILVRNEEPVEYGRELFRVRPD